MSQVFYEFGTKLPAQESRCCQLKPAFCAPFLSSNIVHILMGTTRFLIPSKNVNPKSFFITYLFYEQTAKGGDDNLVH
jgi:hypothetical protein